METELREGLDILEELMDFASENYEHRNVAQQLATAHWKLAKQLQ